MGCPFVYSECLIEAERGTVADIEEMALLQEVDLRLDALKDRLRDLDARLREPDSQQALVDEIAAQEARLDAARQARTALEGEAEAARAKIAAEEHKLYGGTVTDSRELRHLQEEVFALRRGLKAQEEQLLARLETEEAERNAHEYLGTLQEGSREAWDRIRSDLQQQHDQIEAEAATIRADVEEQRSHMGGDDLGVYDAQRQLKRVAVAASVGGVCGACRLALPTTVLTRARRGTQAVPCPACECIVFLR